MNEYEKEHKIIEWLEDYNGMKSRIEFLNEHIEDLAEAGMGISYDKDSISPTNAFNSVTENAVIKMDRHNILGDIKRLQNTVNAIDKALASLTDIQRTVIQNRCIDRKFYYQFCYKIGASERTAKRIKKGALKQMSKVIFGKE